MTAHTNPPEPDLRCAKARARADFLAGIGQGLVLLGWAAILFAPAMLLWQSVAGAGRMFRQAAGTRAGQDGLALTGRMLLEAGGTSLLVGLVAAMVSLALGLPVAVLLTKTDLKWRRLWLTVLLILACTPLYVTTTGWVHCFTLVELTAGFTRQVLATGAIMGIACAPVAAMCVGVGLLGVPQDVEETALMSCASWWVILRVSLPLSLWSVAGAGLLVGIIATGEITVADALWTRTYAEQLYQSFQLCWDARQAMLLALPLMLFLLAGVALLAPMLRGATAAPMNRLWRGSRIVRLGHNRRYAAMLMLLVCVLCLYPLLDLLRFAVTSGRGMSMAWLCRNLEMMLTSSGLAAAGATMAVGLGLPMAWSIRAGALGQYTRLAWVVVIFLLVLPAPLAGVAMILAWNHPGITGMLYDHPLIVALLYATRTTPLAVIVFWCVLQQVPAAHLDDVRLLGVSGFTLMRRFVLPAAGRSLPGVWVLCYILSMAEVGGVVVLVPPGVKLFAVHFATQIHFGVYPDLARMAVIPLVMTIIPVMAWWWCGRRRYDP